MSLGELSPSIFFVVVEKVYILTVYKILNFYFTFTYTVFIVIECFQQMYKLKNDVKLASLYIYY